MTPSPTADGPSAPAGTPEDMAPWWSLWASPGHGPEFLAQAAVTHFTPGARAWSARLRRTYPGATPDKLARLAAREHVRLARTSGAAAALSGPLGPVTGTAAVLALQARLVVHVAAAYQADPSAADLLVLTGVQPSVKAAEATLAAAEKAGSSPARWRAGAPLLRTLGCWAVLKAAARIVPGVTIVLGANADARRIERLADRAIGHYRRIDNRSLNSA